MKNTKLKIMLIGILVFSLGQIAVAEEKEVPVYKLGEIVVTATKSKLSIGEVPCIADVVSKKEIEEKNAKTVDDALSAIAGLYSSRGQGFPTTNPLVTLRGTGYQGRTLILVDGQSINEYYYRGGGVNWEAVPMESIEKIEVIKGPFSALYGGNAMGGVVNIITKRPEKREIIGDISYGSFGTFLSHAGYKDKFGKFGFSLDGNYKKSDGYDKQYLIIKTATGGTATTKVTGWEKTTDKFGKTMYIIGDAGKQWYENKTVSGKFCYDITPYSRLDLRLSHTESSKGWNDWKSFLKDQSGNPVTSGTVQITDEGSNLRLTVKDTDFLQSESDKQTNIVTFNFDHEFSNRINLGATLGLTNQWWGWSTPKTLPGGELNYTPSNNIQAEVKSNIQLNEKNLLTVGITDKFETLSNEIWQLTNWENRSSKTTLLRESKGNVNTVGIFAQDQIQIVSPVTLFLGARFDRWSKYAGYGYDSTFPVTSQKINYPEESIDQITPRISIVYKPFEFTTFRTSWGQAFRGPGPNDLYRTFVTYGKTLYLANPYLKPERLSSYEIGIDQTVAKKTLFRIAYFSNYMDDLLYRRSYTTQELNEYNTQYGTTYTEIKKIENVAKGTSYGIETNIEQDLPLGFSAFANHTYTRTEITDNPVDPSIAGKEFIDSPQHIFNLGLKFAKGPFTARIDYKNVSDMFTEDSNLDTVNGVQGSRDPYSLVDLRIGYKLPVFTDSTVSLGISNLLDNTYYIYNRCLGRTIDASVKVKF